MHNQIWLMFVSICVQTIHSSIEPLVEIENGYILGRDTSTFQNTTYFAFEGIPYAAPPIGELRFKAPQPPENWDGVRNTTYFQTGCYQIADHSLPEESENCLHLNVYTPMLPDGFEDELLPVMVFIHGGGFINGAGFIYTPEYFIDNDVVYVSINYRLGVFGFLLTEDEVIPGNNGLKDQLLALKWTKNNIQLFGGDPDKITIFGESAGAASVAYQLLNQNSAGLFRGAIMQSGSFLSPWAFQRKPRDIAYGLAGLLDPTIVDLDSQSLLEFLQGVDAEELNEAAELYYNAVSLDLHILSDDRVWNETVTNTTAWGTIVSEEILWAPVIEVKNPDAFLTKKMYDLLKAGNVLQIPIVIGINSEESIFFNKDPDVVANALSILDENLDILVPEDMQISDSDHRSEMGRLIRDIYTQGEPFGDNLGAGIRYASDNGFTRVAIKHAELFSDFADTYFYQFSYDGEMGGVSTQYEGAEKVGHAEDLHYLFCYPTCGDTSFPESDYLTRERLVKMWTNFAKYQNPTPEESEILQNVSWPKVYPNNGFFLYLDIGDDLVVSNRPKAESYKAWIDLYDSLEIDSFDTY